MGPWGAIILSFFGGCYFAWASVLLWGWKTPLLIIPVLVFVTFTTLARSRIKNAPPGYYDRDARTGKIIGWSSAGEGIGIFILANILANTGHADLILPGIAFVVGLHFLPMAYFIPWPRLYFAAGFMILAATIGLIVKQPGGSIFTGLVASCLLWTYCARALRRDPAPQS
jgi:hypothetical protein